MRNRKIQRWLLVNFAGNLYAPNALMPDNGLANLAGSLIENGNVVEILDYCTVNSISRLVSAQMSKKLFQIWNNQSQSALTKLRQLFNLSRLDKKKNVLMDKFIHEIIYEISEKIEREKIQAVGLKLWAGDGFRGSVKIADKLKTKFPHLKIFGGGPQVDAFMEHLFAKCEFDALVYGEGEETIKHLADNIHFSEIPNLLYFDGNSLVKTTIKMIENLDTLPMPNYDQNVYPAMSGNQKIKIIVIDDSRGCKNNCAFCPHPIKSNKFLRRKSTKRLIEEINILKNKYSINTFRFAGSCTPYELLNEFSEKVLKDNIRVNFSSFAHLRDGEKADFKKMADAGCRALFFGIESGSQAILNKMKKGTRIEEIKDTLQKSKNSKIFTVGSLIYPAPGETLDSENETLGLITETLPDSLTIQSPIVAPRTDWYENEKSHGIKIKNKEKYKNKLIYWDVKFLLPPIFWEKLPILINGTKFKRILTCTTNFVKKIQNELGMLTSVSDEMYLMSLAGDYEISEFKRLNQEAFFTGNIDIIKTIVERINAGIYKETFN